VAPVRALDLDEVQTELAAQYCDHQTFQFDFKNTDDHRFLRSAAGTFGAHFSRPGNGICHNVHKENFAAPGKTMLGSDSHTPTPGGMGELAIGAGGLDIAVAMGGGAYYVEMPEVVSVRLEGELPAWATAKDVILELLRRLSVKGGVGKVLEYTGPGVESLTVPERRRSPTWGRNSVRPPRSSRPTSRRETTSRDSAGRTNTSTSSPTGTPSTPTKSSSTSPSSNRSSPSRRCQTTSSRSARSRASTSTRS